MINSSSKLWNGMPGWIQSTHIDESTVPSASEEINTNFGFTLRLEKVFMEPAQAELLASTLASSHRLSLPFI